MKLSLITTLTLVSAATLASAQNDNLLFTTLNQYGPQKTLSGSSGLNMSVLQSEDVELVHPTTAGPYSAEKFASEKNWQAVMGDADADAFFYQSPLFGQIDAILALHPGRAVPTMRDVYLSPSQSVGGPAGREIKPGDVASIRPNGTLHFFLKATQVKDAFDMQNEPNVDAICRDNAGNLFLSFEDDEWILGGTVLALDGDMLVIPAGAIAYAVDGTVAGVATAGGFVAQTEVQMDVRVANSGYRNETGFAITFISDLDGLTLDPNGGTFTSVWNGTVYNFPNLLFCGRAMTGCGVNSTAGGGTLGMMNGAPLASAVLTNGTPMGIAPGVDGSGSLNGLHLNSAVPHRFVMDAPNVDFSAAPGTVVMEWGGADPFAPVWLWYAIVPRVAGTAAPSFSVGGSCFPDVFIASPMSFLPSDAAGFGSVSGVTGGLGIPVVMQMITAKAGFGLGWSAPILLEL